MMELNNTATSYSELDGAENVREWSLPVADVLVLSQSSSSSLPRRQFNDHFDHFISFPLYLHDVMLQRSGMKYYDFFPCDQGTYLCFIIC